jgi:C4-dicarboxylate-specific signal transduction histidine kinase
MEPSNPYKVAFERERQARLLAEKLLDEKTRNLYENFLKLETTINELKSTQKQLIQSEKMASIGQLAAGVAHEINNPIGFSISNLSILVEYIDSLISLDDFMSSKLSLTENTLINQSYQQFRDEKEIDYIKSDIYELLDGTNSGLNKVKKIVNNLKKVSRFGNLEKKNCDMSSLIDESLAIVWNELKYCIEVDKKLKDLPQIKCHETEIQQVLVNIFTNAADAIQEKEEGLITVSTNLIQNETVKYLKIEISDNGKGIPEKLIHKIFDPFFTTKTLGEGTGLGLSISFSIIEKHDGKLEVNSIENKNTRFTIHLPY